MKIKRESANNGTCWHMVILADDGREVARYKIAKSEILYLATSIDSAIRRMRYALKKHLDNGGTLGNYQF